MSVILETPRLLICEFIPEDEETYLNHFTDEEVCLYLPKRSREERLNIFRTALANYATGKLTGTWSMTGKADHAFIGSCLLRAFNDEPGKLELGYSMEKKYWGKGIGTEMAAAMIAYGLAGPGVTAVVAVTVPANIASQKVLEKAGLERRENIIRNGEELAFFSSHE